VIALSPAPHPCVPRTSHAIRAVAPRLGVQQASVTAQGGDETEVVGSVGHETTLAMSGFECSVFGAGCCNRTPTR
jgi:hypothetical protein